MKNYFGVLPYWSEEEFERADRVWSGNAVRSDFDNEIEWLSYCKRWFKDPQL